MKQLENIPTGIFKEYIYTFNLNKTYDWKHPWEDSYELTPQERAAIIPSMQQFELGEGSDGVGLKQRAAKFSKLAGDLSYLQAIKLFIAEEQRHSELLSRFLNKQASSPLAGHWLDWCFRKIRRLAGIETMASVLVAAEIIAVPYYRALRGATDSRLLKSICSQILAEESVHIEFQATSIALMRVEKPPFSRACNKILHSALLEVALRLVWREHRQVFERGNYTFRELKQECQQGLFNLNLAIDTKLEELKGRALCNATSFAVERCAVKAILRK